MNVVIYARYSDGKQREESIEGQLKVCHDYAERNGYNVINEYIDRAVSGRTDDRPQFKRMIKDSYKGNFNGIIVYQLDRFARNRIVSAKYKETLQNNNVSIISARENISKDASGILMETLLEGMAEYFSVELSQKVARGMDINAEKGLANGGTTPLGYRIENKHYVLDENTAPIVKEIFQKYAADWSIRKICDSLNERHIKTATGKTFNRSSLHTMLKNRKYLGIYIYNGHEIPGGMPQIIDEELFNKVQRKMLINKNAPARSRARAEYILSGKLFCGYCKEKMTGHSSNQVSKKGVIFNYYKCKNSGKGKTCKKKMVHKDYIEDLVVNECKRLLTPQNIKRIAKEVIGISNKMDDRSEIKRLERLIKKNQEEKVNQMTSLRLCKDDTIREMIFEDLSKISEEADALERQLEIEKARHVALTEEDIVNYLSKLFNGNIHDKAYRKSLIQMFVNKIFLYDDRFTITFNTGDEEVTITDDLLHEIEGESLCALNHPVHHKSGSHYADRF